MPDCPVIPEETYGIFSKRVHKNVIDERVPIVGSMELTLRCNLRCVHCYCEGSRDEGQLGTDELKSVIGKVADAGCLWLLLTGGEPLLRPDFPEIYLYVKERGIIPTLFTNATLVDAGMAKLLADWPPFWIEVTLYGATRETYERVTGVKGSYDKCMRGIELLLKHELNLKLKTMVLKENVHELEQMYGLAGGLGLEFRHDALLNPTLSGGRDPAAHRVDIETVIELDRRYNAEVDTWRDFIRESRDLPPAETLIGCGSGINSFHVDPQGMLGLCLLARTEAYDLRSGEFLEGWNGPIAELRSRRPGRNYRCGNCGLRHLCGSCAAWAGLETGSPEASVDYLCRVTAMRAREFGGPETRRMADEIFEELDHKGGDFQ